MPDDQAPPENQVEKPLEKTSNTSGGNKMSERVYLVSYPKIVFLYPTFLAAIAAGVYMSVVGNVTGAENHLTEMVAAGFLAIFTLNLFVLAFDFPRTTSLTLFFFCFATICGLYILFTNRPELLGSVGDAIKQVKPWANATFYYIVTGILGSIFCMVAIYVRFDYWEVRPNELLHHHGFLSDMERLSAPHLRIDKEINDVFEYLLCRSGRLILQPRNSPRAIILENVFFISSKEKKITQMLGALQVQVRSEE